MIQIEIQKNRPNLWTVTFREDDDDWSEPETIVPEQLPMKLWSIGMAAQE